MNRTRFLLLGFDKPLQAYDIRKFRAAVIETTNRKSDLFHNHIGDTSYLYRYPLIQYKIKEKKPCIVCFKDATEDIHYLLQKRKFVFDLNGKQYKSSIEDIQLRYVNIRTLNRPFTYNVHNYLPLNQENYSYYRSEESLLDKIKFVERMLLKHLKIYADAMNAYLPFSIKSKILNINNTKYIEYKKIFHLSFSINFKSNLYIPDYAGIGKGTSIGFGIVKRLSRNRIRHKNKSITNKTRYETNASMP